MEQLNVRMTHSNQGTSISDSLNALVITVKWQRRFGEVDREKNFLSPAQLWPAGWLAYLGHYAAVLNQCQRGACCYTTSGVHNTLYLCNTCWSGRFMTIRRFWGTNNGMSWDCKTYDCLTMNGVSYRFWKPVTLHKKLKSKFESYAIRTCKLWRQKKLSSVLHTIHWANYFHFKANFKDVTSMFLYGDGSMHQI